MQPPRFNMKVFLAIAIPALLCALYLALTSFPSGSCKEQDSVPQVPQGSQGRSRGKGSARRLGML